MTDKLLIDRTLLEQALDALLHRRGGSDQVQRIDAAITDLCAALAQQAEPVQEPVAQAMQDAAVYGVGISRDGKRIDPASIYEQPAQPDRAPAYKVKVAGRWHDAEPFAAAFDLPDGEHLLYTAPPQRPPLTDEEIDAITRDRWGTQLLGVLVQAHREYARAIERKVRGEA